ncbi:MAG: YchJ family protein [Gammaproteobacteria bacterium]
MNVDEACPCGGGAYAVCCGPLHEGAPAASAEALMRSRYSAFVQARHDYLLATWHARTRPAHLDREGPAPKWLGLTVKKHAPDGERATVEFVARYRVAGRGHRLHEASRFVREDGRWYYVDGEIL